MKKGEEASWNVVIISSSQDNRPAGSPRSERTVRRTSLAAHSSISQLRGQPILSFKSQQKHSIENTSYLEGKKARNIILGTFTFCISINDTITQSVCPLEPSPYRFSLQKGIMRTSMPLPWWRCALLHPIFPHNARIGLQLTTRTPLPNVARRTRLGGAVTLRQKHFVKNEIEKRRNKSVSESFIFS